MISTSGPHQNHPIKTTLIVGHLEQGKSKLTNRSWGLQDGVMTGDVAMKQKHLRKTHEVDPLKDKVSMWGPAQNNAVSLLSSLHIFLVSPPVLQE